MMMNYNIIFYYSPADKAFVTSVPELPGCMADGETIEEAIANTKEIINEWIEDAKADGIKIPAPLTRFESSQASCIDIANYILKCEGKITTFALEKLVYYCKVWSLVWYGNAITTDRVEARVNGPVFPKLFKQHQGRRYIDESSLRTNHELSDSEKKFIEYVLSVYDNFNGSDLRNMTHREAPWNIARGDIPDSAASSKEITNKMILDYYKIA